MRNIKKYKINQLIKYPKVRVVSSTGENLGVMDTNEALRKSQGDEMDLILIVENANPPVAKILDFNKFLYDEQKKSSVAKAKSKKSEVKELRFGPTIGEGDLHVKIDRTKEFLADGNRVKVTVVMKGREATHPEVGIVKLRTFINELKDEAKTEADLKRIGNSIFITFVGK